MHLVRCLPILAILLFLPVLADETTASAPPKEKAKKATSAQAAKPASAGSALTVARDPVTGALRPLTPEEASQLLGRRALVAAEPQVVTLPDGTKMMRLGPDQASLSVMRRNPDGTFASACVHGPEEARVFLEAAPAAAPARAAREK